MSFLGPIAVAVGLWWLTTIVALYRTGLPRSTYGATFAASTALGLAGLAVIAITRDASDSAGAYAAFAGALCVWAWHEMGYLLGYVTGPRPEACPPGESAGGRFRFGVMASLYHELAIVATVALVAGMTAGQSNPVALWTLAVLWLMRWSVKLNIFLGVRNLHLEYLPRHLGYLTSYVRRRDMNLWFPVSIVAAVYVVAALVAASLDPLGSDVASTGLLLAATLLALAVLEHLLLMLDVSDDALWRLATAFRAGRAGSGNAP